MTSTQETLKKETHPKTSTQEIMENVIFLWKR